MIQIGYYYSEKGLFHLYKTNMMKQNWVTNICYYDTFDNKYYSPNIKNLMSNSRDNQYRIIPYQKWNDYITYSHDSFVLK
jgi:hypothetical protein